ncbi:DUF4136 domain-containing protein [Sediminicola luteus]|uniref:DUF4136 domain-containing protein n=1 Tax=Sediminicola luteus TaxID=319238 RepID=A0A2A4GCQ1_9FLAO|nr:DUF4136 domain-containing protein [Sediminicola luteus]PCE65750.1 hypothetical protein B7P33_00135 [Sediminicola luteus]
MKNAFYLLLSFVFLLGSCTSVRVLSDYDKEVDFNGYKTYAFYRTGIDKAQISDLDKKRILRAVEREMSQKGYVKSKTPDLLVSIFTKEREQVDVYRNAGFMYGWSPYYWGWGWGPGFYGDQVSVSTEGSLYIDLLDAKKKELVWQGKGVGTLSETSNIEKKEERINEFVAKIMTQYPPGQEGE